MRVKPWGDMDLETHWGWLPVEGKVVLDVGAEHGSTADFFLSKGAAGVIAVEGDQRAFRRLEAWAETRGSVDCVQMRIASAADWRELLSSYPAQVVKVDCEGGEGYLLDVDDRLVCRPEAWAVELHTKEMAERFGNAYPWGGVETLHVRFKNMLLYGGYDIAKDVPHMAGRVICGVRGDLLLLMRPGNSESRTRAVIVGKQRSGARLLEECLASHPNVESGGELLREAPPWPNHVLQDFFEGGEAEVQVCRLMYDQLPAPTVAWLQMNEVSVIHLVREDHIRREVSNWINRHRERLGQSSAHSCEEATPVQVEVDVAWVAKQIQVAKAQIEAYRRLFESGPYLEITYMDMVGWEGREISELPLDVDAKLLRFLELDPHPLTTNLRKQNPGNLASVVVNYNELMAAFAQ
jgi:hypothetical protein